MSEITYEDIYKIAHEACPKIREKRRETFTTLREGFDLPGGWPVFYLYQDLTWSIGYNPEAKSVISLTMVDNHNEITLIEAVKLNLKSDYSIGERKVIPQDHSVKEQKVKEDDPLDPLEVKQESSDKHPKKKDKRRTKLKVATGKRRGRPPKHKELQ